MNLDENKYTLFRLPDQRLVAIDGENQKVLGHCLGIWRSYKNVPVDRTVRGIFVDRTNGGLQSVDESAQQNDITVNQLQPEN